MATNKGSASGPRTPFKWGTVKKKVAGKSVSVDAISSIQKSVVDVLGIKLKPPVNKKIAVKKDKKGRLYLPKSSGTKSTKRYLMASADDGATFHSVPIPSGLGYGQAKTILQKNSKVTFAKTPQEATPQALSDKPKAVAKTASKGAKKK